MTTTHANVEAVLPVTAVTLFEDRGRVVRQGTVDLPQGLVRVEVAGVAPVLSDRSLYAIAESKGARVVHARVLRRFVPSGTGRPTSDGLAPEREQLQRRIAELAETIRVLEAHAAAADALAARTLREITEDASAGGEDPSGWDAALDRVGETERSLVRRTSDLRQQLEKLESEAARLQDRIAASATPSHEHWAAVEMSVEVSAAGPHELRVGYIVPGACWRPYHTARLEGSRILFRTDACVWQRTGEDWNAVRLEFSTHRPSQGLVPPELKTDLLATRKRPENVVVESRDQEIATTGLGAAKVATAADLPGIDDRGDVVSLTARTRSTVPSDGRPYRVELFAFDAPAELSLIAMPERATAVVLRSVQTNTAASPILAGPVDLIREGGLAGRTSLMFVAPGESFPLGWGPEGEVRLHREVEQTREAPRLLNAWELRHQRVTDRLSNVGARALTVQVVERVPVSEVEKVVVQPDTKATTDQAAPDADGFVRWTAELPAHGRKTLDLKYVLRRHQDVTVI